MIHAMPRELSNSELLALAPAVGATAPVAKASDRYTFVPTLSVVDLMRDMGWFPIEVKQGNARDDARIGFQRHQIRFTHAEMLRRAIQERVDMVLNNSHDTGSAFELALSIWRLVCSNGMMAPYDFAAVRHKHLGFSPEQFIESAKEVAAHSAQLIERVEDFKTIELTPDEKGVFASAVHELLYEPKEGRQAPISASDLLVPRRNLDFGDDLWRTFNIVQENVIKGGIRGFTRSPGERPRRMTTRPVKSLDRDIKLNRAIWTLTEKMAELKEV